MVKNTNVTTPNEFPLLTWQVLERLDRKAQFRKITPSDCELIDHYLTSIGGDGWLIEFLEEVGVFSFEDIAEALTMSYSHDLRPSAVAGFLRGCIQGLIDRVQEGEKIY